MMAQLAISLGPALHAPLGHANPTATVVRLCRPGLTFWHVGPWAKMGKLVHWTPLS